jgi:hypothetical protein
MKPIIAVALFFGVLFNSSCSSSRKPYAPQHKYPYAALLKDYRLLREILEQKHPSLYWYTPKDSMNYYFSFYEKAIADSMTEREFAWKVLAPLTAKIRCGHTSVSMSKAYARWSEGKQFSSFPLSLKIWNDSMAVTGNLNRKDSLLKPGVLISSINGKNYRQLVSEMFDYLPRDGYADNINFIRLSSNFRNYHRNIYGLSEQYSVTFQNKTGANQTVSVPLYRPLQKDSLRKDSSIARKTVEKEPRKNRLLPYRSLQIDSSGKMAYMYLNTFSKGKLRRFFHRSFVKMRKENIQHLVLDIRNNGGGRVGLSTLLTRYLRPTPFKVADTLQGVAKSLGKYTKYSSGKWLNNVELFFISKRKKDGFYHIRHLENKTYQPKRKNHYNGNVYVLISGPTFSAASIVASALKGQKNCTLIGEETGGGWYGNNGIMIPDIILPYTHTRVRLPLFRLVQYQHPAQKGTGIVPDIYLGTSYEAILKGYDFKRRWVMDYLRKTIEKKL